VDHHKHLTKARLDPSALRYTSNSSPAQLDFCVLDLEQRSKGSVGSVRYAACQSQSPSQSPSQPPNLPAFEPSRGSHPPGSSPSRTAHVALLASHSRCSFSRISRSSFLRCPSSSFLRWVSGVSVHGTVRRGAVRRDWTWEVQSTERNSSGGRGAGNARAKRDKRMR
jgi:hypothetical protein